MNKLSNEEIARAIQVLKGTYKREWTAQEIEIGRAALEIVAKNKKHAEELLIARRKVATASNLHSANINGYMLAKASKDHPLQLELELFITDFLPNANKQGVKRSEAENILRTAKNSPLKVSFDGAIKGHKGATVIGTITEVQDKIDRIIGRAVIWEDIADDIADYIKAQAQLFTSWEIYFADSERDSSGIDWLQGCVFAGSCIVSTPAYGERAKATVRA